MATGNRAEVLNLTKLETRSAAWLNLKKSPKIVE